MPEKNPRKWNIKNLADCLFGGFAKCECGIKYEWHETTSSFSDALRGDGKIVWVKHLACPNCGRIIDEKFIKFITIKERDNWIKREFPWQMCDVYGYISGNLVDDNLIHGSKNKQKCIKCKNFVKCKRVLNNIKNAEEN